MRNKIIEHIAQLEKEKDITILLAVESGSRAWGCPSPDSDYDVRMIFKRSKSEYLMIDEKPQSIDYFLGDLLDISGWDIKKTLKLIRKSNVTPFEWIQSPIVYKEVGNFRETLLGLSHEYFQPKHSVNHYRGIAKNSFAGMDLNSSIKLKKLFYVIRPLMAAKWILLKKEIPPMDIPNLISIIDNTEVINHIKSLLKVKETANENYVHQAKPLISDFIKQEFDYINSTKLEELNSEINNDKLNKAFIEIIEQ